MAIFWIHFNLMLIFPPSDHATAHQRQSQYTPSGANRPQRWADRVPRNPGMLVVVHTGGGKKRDREATNSCYLTWAFFE